MGKIEETTKQRLRKGTIERAVFKSIAAVGVLSIALCTPNALQMLESFGIDLKARHGDVVANARRRLLRNKCLEYNTKGFLRLTPKGETRLRHLELFHTSTAKPRKWDGKWRVLIFDISEKRKGTRNMLRRTLTAIGFTALQQSVFVYPYDCEDLIALLKADFRIGKELLYMIVDALEDDSMLRTYFGLPEA